EDAVGRSLTDRSAAVIIAAHRGELDEARRRWEPMSILTEDAEPQMRALAHSIESELLLAEGRARDALAVARDGLRLSFDNRFALSSPMGKYLYGFMLEAALELGDREAVEDGLALVDMARPVERRPYVAGAAALARGRLAALDGDRSAAEAHLREAVVAFGR